ncbi:unnamed protein product [Phaeothamnion confervicola]
MYAWGNSFFEPLVDMEHSKLGGRANLEKIAAELEAGDNVFLLSNHQTEADPQAREANWLASRLLHNKLRCFHSSTFRLAVISLLMEREGFGAIASRLINVAGHRVTTDPLAIPFSMGRNLFCIYSKKYMESPPELKSEKQRHNIRTLKKMADMMVNKELGERRQADRGPVSVAFGEEIIAGEGMGRAEFAAAMEAAVKADYAKLDAFHRDQDC